MKAPMVFEIPPYPGYFSESMTQQAQGHSLLNAQTESALDAHSKEMLLADMKVTADVLEQNKDYTSALHLRQEMKRLK